MFYILCKHRETVRNCEDFVSGCRPCLDSYSTLKIMGLDERPEIILKTPR